MFFFKQGTTSTQRNDVIRTIIWLTASFIWNTIMAYHLPVRMYMVYTHVLHKTGKTFSEYNIGLPSSSLDARGLHPCTPQNWRSPRWAKGHPTKMATQGYRTTKIKQWFSNLRHFFDSTHYGENNWFLCFSVWTVVSLLLFRYFVVDNHDHAVIFCVCLLICIFCLFVPDSPAVGVHYGHTSFVC